MLAIKLKRIGRKHQPSYRIVVAEKRSKLGGEPVEDLGSYVPFSKTLTVNGERVNYWIGVGAQLTVTAHNLLVQNGVVKDAKRAVRIPFVEPEPEPEPEPVAPAAAEPEAEEAPAEPEAAAEAPTESVAEAPTEEAPAEPAA